RMSFLKQQQKSTRDSNINPGRARDRQDGIQFERPRLRELEVRVANPQHWSAGEHQINVENLRQLRFQIEDQLKKLRQQT
ncbi:MAG: hypothetical protein GY878_29320, partial [Fuerstiella sp.]|nr:hypothetical protein [Fuerstiella sp.]